MGLESTLPEGMVVTTTLEKLVDWGRGRSPFPFLFGLACCAIEMMAAGGPRHDVARFGAEVFRGTPRQSDVMIISGRVSRKMAPVLRTIYEQMPNPKWAIAMGACASSGGFYKAYHVVQGIAEVIPVDVYVPGCPPTPEGLIYGILELKKRIETGETRELRRLREER